ncbi:hypothetical protein [Nocardia sp. CDC160]|uniref:hypothetical protein n=1 Tax=Nocardia sp. CDC160 TaxID=3112166 RepID=UPI002DB598F5|nr:hypothetical protein [Nocardia sp. CDC160]MEC3917972.1 hypothetical protein [Nocardia sp. CDC160]
MSDVAARDQEVLQTLQKRDGSPSTVVLDDGSSLTVYNIAWGYDIGDASAHITTNISPEIENSSIDFFYTAQVISVIDRETGGMLFDVPA